MKIFMKKLIYILTLTILLPVSCKEKDEVIIQDKTFCLDENTKKIIEISSVQKQNVVEVIPLSGNIETNPDEVVNYVSLVNGVISNTYFSLGDKVTKGQILAELQSSELSSLKSELNSLKAQIEIAKVELNSKKDLFKDGISSNKDLIEATNNLQILETEKQKIESNLKLYSASNSKNVFQIKAPTSGIITEKNINSGTTVTDDGDVLFSISNLNNVWAMANIYASDIGRIQSGMNVEIETLSYPNETFSGRINLISQILDQETKTLKARIDLDNADFKLKPGMIADIRVLNELNSQEIAIPTASILFYDNKNYVLVYHDDCEIEKREITLLSKRNGLSYIGSGLKENEKIITKNQLLILEALNN